VTERAGASIAAVSLSVPDYDDAIAFFCGGLGWTLCEDLAQGAKRWVTVEPPAGGCRLVLARADLPAQRAAIGAQGGGRVWLFLQTDDFDRDAARLTDAGAIFEERPRHEPYGKVAVWRDPWGNRWDLIQPRK
jgi:predicted enzyme related to lactoylglutathione lyase